MTGAGNVDSGPFFSADFTSSSSERLNAGNTAFAFGDTDWWIGLWVRRDVSGSADIIIQQINGVAEGIQLIKLGTEVLRLRVYSATSIIGQVNSVDTLSLNVWHYVFIYHDSTGNEVGVSIDDNAFVTAATSGAAGVSTANFYFGNSATNSWDGRMDEAALGQSPPGGFSTTPPASIRNALYNGGAGKRYVQLTSVQKTAWGLVSYYGFDEMSGTRVDSHGSNDLSDENTVGHADGKVRP